MRIATATLSSAAPYSQSREYASEVPALNGEQKDAYDERTWRNHCHVNGNGFIIMPPMAFKLSLDTAASMLGIKIPGKRGATMTKYFLSGVLVMEPLALSVRASDLPFDKIYCSADGKRGSGKRVWRRYPRIDQWSGDVEFNVLADEITEEGFDQALRQTGAFVGVGRFRPQVGGFYGRFKVEKIIWN